MDSPDRPGFKWHDNFDIIYVNYYPRMIRFAREYVLLEEDAENIVQDIFVIL